MRTVRIDIIALLCLASGCGNPAGKERAQSPGAADPAVAESGNGISSTDVAAQKNPPGTRLRARHSDATGDPRSASTSGIENVNSAPVVSVSSIPATQYSDNTLLISWTVNDTDPGGTSTIEFSPDNGATWQSIVSATAPGATSYAWRVPVGDHPAARVRVSTRDLAGNVSAPAVSNVFRIYPMTLGTQAATPPALSASTPPDSLFNESGLPTTTAEFKAMLSQSTAGNFIRPRIMLPSSEFTGIKARRDNVAAPDASFNAIYDAVLAEANAYASGTLGTGGAANSWSKALPQYEATNQPADDNFSAPGPQPIMLELARSVVKEITTLALMARVEPANPNRPKWVARARDVMISVAGFSDWNFYHTLTASEFTAGLAIGYDWLFADLSSLDRPVIRDAIINKSLLLAQRYRANIYPYNWGNYWRAQNNWSIVTNSGFTLGALAVAETGADQAARGAATALSFDIVTNSVKFAKQGFRNYRPEGAWFEGPTYWGYAAAYAARMLPTLETGLGGLNNGTQYPQNHFGLKTAPGLSDTSDFLQHMIAPNNRNFNYGDAAEGPDPAPALHYFAKAFSKPMAAGLAHEKKWNDPFALMFWTGTGVTGAGGTVGGNAVAPLPRNVYYPRIGVGAWRSDWGPFNAAYLAYKGGENGIEHAHLDLGTYVWDGLGKRWAADLGLDKYSLSGYFDDSTRYNYYRTSTLGQNSLRIGNQSTAAPIYNWANQPPSARASVFPRESTATNHAVLIDLSQAYPQATSVWRGLRSTTDGGSGNSAQSRHTLVVHDEIRSSTGVQVGTGMHIRVTPSDEVVLSTTPGQGNTIRIRTGAGTTGDAYRYLHGRIIHPVNARFELTNLDTILGTTDTGPTYPANSFKRLDIRLSGDPTIRNVDIVVEYTATYSATTPAPSATQTYSPKSLRLW